MKTQYLLVSVMAVLLWTHAHSADTLPYYSRLDEAILTVAPTVAHHGILDFGVGVDVGYSFPHIRPYAFGCKSIITTNGGVGVSAFHQFRKGSKHREQIDISTSFSSFNLYFADTLINAMITEVTLGSDWLISAKDFGNWQPRLLVGLCYMNINNDEHGFGFVFDGRNEYKNIYVRFPLRILQTGKGGLSYLGAEFGYHILRKQHALNQ